MRIIKDDPRARPAQQVNLTSAIRGSILALPERFAESDLFERIACLSYGDDIRMIPPAESRNKVGNIAQKRDPQLYYCPALEFLACIGNVIEPRSCGTTLPDTRLAHCANRVTEGCHFFTHDAEDATKYWAQFSARPNLASIIPSSKFTHFTYTLQSDRHRF